jgi:hypothetical protein
MDELMYFIGHNQGEGAEASAYNKQVLACRLNSCGCECQQKIG